MIVVIIVMPGFIPKALHESTELLVEVLSTNVLGPAITFLVGCRGVRFSSQGYDMQREKSCNNVCTTDPSMASNQCCHERRAFLELSQVKDADAIGGLARAWKAVWVFGCYVFRVACGTETGRQTLFSSRRPWGREESPCTLVHLRHVARLKLVPTLQNPLPDPQPV